MIPRKELISTIEAFNKEFNEVASDCAVSTEPSDEHFKYFLMINAWTKVQNVIEMELLPLIEK